MPDLRALVCWNAWLMPLGSPRVLSRPLPLLEKALVELDDSADLQVAEGRVVMLGARQVANARDLCSIPAYRLLNSEVVQFKTFSLLQSWLIS